MAARGDESLPEEIDGTPDVRDVFAELITGSPQDYRVYVYQVRPQPEHDPMTPAYVARWPWAQVEDSLEEKIAELRPAGGFFRVELRKGSARIHTGFIQTAARAGGEHAGGDGRLASALERIEGRLQSLERMPAGNGVGLDIESLIALVQAMNPSAVAGQAALESHMKALELGMQLRDEMEPGDSQADLMTTLAAIILPQLQNNGAGGAAAQPTGGAPAAGRPGMAPSARTAQPAARRRRKAPVVTRRRRPPSASAREADTTPAEEAAAAEGDGIEEARRAQEPEPAAASTPGDLEQLVYDIDGAINQMDDADWWAGYVRRRYPDLAPGLNAKAFQAVRERVKKHPDFPGLNSPTAGEWIREFLERLELAGLVAAGHAQAESQGQSST